MIPPQFTPTVTVYANPEFVSIHTYSGYRRLALDRCFPPVQLNPSDSTDIIGSQVRLCLEQSRLIDQAEIESYFNYRAVKAAYEDWVALMMKNYGYRSRRFMFAKMNVIRIRSDQSCFTLTGLEMVRREEWTSPREASSIIEISNASGDAEIGGALNVLINGSS